KVTGQLCLRDARVGTAPVTLAVSASGLAVDGDVDASRLQAREAVSMPSAVITGSVDLTAARITSPAQKALVMDHCGIGGRLDCASIGCCYGTALTCKGQLSLNGARISGDLDLTGAALEAGDGQPALLGQRGWLDGTLVLSAIKAQGEVDLRTLKVGASLLLN